MFLLHYKFERTLKPGIHEEETVRERWNRSYVSFIHSCQDTCNVLVIICRMKVSDYLLNYK